VLLLAWLLAVPAVAQVNDKAYADYFLVGQFGEVCTMCEVMVLCEAGAATPSYAGVPESGSFTLYHIHTRTFWSQVSTIWEWFIANFNSRSLAAGHSRPVTTYRVADGTWARLADGDLLISLDPPLIRLPDGQEIDRTNRRWRQTSPPAELGYCQRLPLWDALNVIEKRGFRENMP
jgi:hypothetical protein